MNIVIWSVLLIVFTWVVTSKITIVQYYARGLAVVIALAAVAAAIGLVAVGQKSQWTSGEPGMLLIMVGIPICSLVAGFFGALAFTAMARLEEPAFESPSGATLLRQPENDIPN